MESATCCHDAHVVGSCWDPCLLAALAAKSEDYITVPQHLERGESEMRKESIRLQNFK